MRYVISVADKGCLYMMQRWRIHLSKGGRAMNRARHRHGRGSGESLVSPVHVVAIRYREHDRSSMFPMTSFFDIYFCHF
jgi:hypothetical protein